MWSRERSAAVAPPVETMLPDLASGPAATGRGFQLSADWVACPNAALIDMLAVLRLASDELRCSLGRSCARCSIHSSNAAPLLFTGLAELETLEKPTKPGHDANLSRKTFETIDIGADYFPKENASPA